MIPLLSKMDLRGDQASNWEFSWNNYATATKLDQKDKKMVAVPAISQTKEAVHYRNSCDSKQNRRQHGNQISG